MLVKTNREEKITGKKLYGIVKADELELEVILKVGKMPFNLKINYFTEGEQK